MCLRPVWEIGLLFVGDCIRRNRVLLRAVWARVLSRSSFCPNYSSSHLGFGCSDAKAVNDDSNLHKV